MINYFEMMDDIYPEYIAIEDVNTLLNSHKTDTGYSEQLGVDITNLQRFISMRHNLNRQKPYDPTN